MSSIWFAMMLVFAPGKSQVLIRNFDLDQPQSLVVAATGDLYLLDSDSRKIWCYDAKGELRFKFGEKGSGPGLFETPTDMAVLKNGNLVVLDGSSRRMSIFDAKGTYLKQAQLSLASIGQVLALPNGNLLVSSSNGNVFNFILGEKDKNKPRFQIIDLEGKIVGQLGEMIPHENPLLEMGLNSGFMTQIGERVYFAGKIKAEWIVYEGGKAAITAYKPGYMPREPSAVMKEVPQSDGSKSFKLSAVMDTICLGLVALNDKELIMLRPSSAGDEDGIPTRLVVVDLKGKVLREDPEQMFAHKLAISAKRDKLYMVSESDEDGWVVLSKDVP